MASFIAEPFPPGASGSTTMILVIDIMSIDLPDSTSMKRYMTNLWRNSLPQRKESR